MGGKYIKHFLVFARKMNKICFLVEKSCKISYFADNMFEIIEV